MQSSRRSIYGVRFRIDAHLYFFTLRTELPNRVFFVATDETSRATDAITTKSFVGVDELRTHGTKSLWAWRSGIASFTVVVAFVEEMALEVLHVDERPRLRVGSHQLEEVEASLLALHVMP